MNYTKIKTMFDSQTMEGNKIRKKSVTKEKRKVAYKVWFNDKRLNSIQKMNHIQVLMGIE